MEFDKNLQQYYYQYEGLVFVWDEEPDEKFIDIVKMLSKKRCWEIDFGHS